MIHRRCFTCKWWDCDITDFAAGATMLGICRALPPMRYQDEEVYERAQWPETMADSWCGAYTDREEQR